MSEAFARALGVVLDAEGGASDRLLDDDPGGPTVYGISRVAHPDIPWPPTILQAAEIYRTEYWEAIRGDELPWPVALVVFDAAVQHGARDAIRFLQLALGFRGRAVDGILGGVTLAAVRQLEDPSLCAEDMQARRGCYYPTLPNWASNQLGWMRRLLAVHRASLTPPD